MENQFKNRDTFYFLLSLQTKLSKLNSHLFNQSPSLVLPLLTQVKVLSESKCVNGAISLILYVGPSCICLHSIQVAVSCILYRAVPFRFVTLTKSSKDKQTVPKLSDPTLSQTVVKVFNFQLGNQEKGYLMLTQESKIENLPPIRSTEPANPSQASL